MTHSEELEQLDCIDDHLSWKVEPWMGMVRASFGLYNTIDDIDFLLKSLEQIIDRKSYFIDKYSINESGDYQHKSFNFSSKDFFSLTGSIDKNILST